MATAPFDRPVSPMRQRMLDGMAMRAMRSRTQQDYVRHVRAFAAFLGRSPDTATAEDVRRFQLHQREQGVWGVHDKRLGISAALPLRRDARY